MRRAYGGSRASSVLTYGVPYLPFGLRGSLARLRAHPRRSRVSAYPNFAYGSREQQRGARGEEGS